MLRPSVAQFDLGAHGGQQLAGGFNVAHLRNIFQNDRLFRKQGRGHGRQCGILRPADANRPQQRIAPADYELIHTASILMATMEKSVQEAVTPVGHGLR